MAGGPLCDRSQALCDMQRKRREEEDLRTQYEERKQMLESLQQRTDELHKEIKKARELHLSFDVFLKDEDADQAAEKAERERTEVLQQEAELERLKVEHVELMERKRELQRQMQRHSLYWDFMGRGVKMAKFDDVQALTGHLESLLHFRDHLYRQDKKAQEQVDEQRKALLTLQEQHHVLRLHKNIQLSRLQTEMDKTCSEALTWEKKWNHIQDTAAKKTLLLGQMKMATLNLYEMADDKVEGEEAVDMNDSEKQLDEVKMFIQEYENIMKRQQTPTQRHDGQKKDRTKPEKCLTTHCKKHASV